MPSTNTSNLNLEKPADGEQSGEWGDTINSNMELIDAAVATKTGSETLTNKTLTSPVLNTGVSGTAVKDENNMASDSATHLATQQSIKAYVDSQSASEEEVEDIVGAMTTSNTETGIAVTYEDSDGTLDFVVSDTTVSGDTGSTGITPGDTLTIAGGTNVSTAMSGDTLTIASTDTNTQLSQEQVEDFVGGMVDSNTETGIAVTYQDADGTLDFVVADTTVAGDSGSTGITPGDTLTIAGGANITTAMSGDTLTVTGSASGALADLDIDGGTDIGEALVDADLFIVDNGANGTNRKSALSRLKTYVTSDNTLTLYKFTATAGQTTFTGNDDSATSLAYTAGALFVTLNGSVLENGTDYAATNGTSVVLTDAAALSHELNVYAFGTFNVATVTGASGDFSVADDQSFTSDAAVVNFGVNSDVTLTHVHDSGLSMSAGANLTTLELATTSTSTNTGPLLRLQSDKGTPADSDYIGQIHFNGKNHAGEDVLYGSIYNQSNDVTDGTEDGRMSFYTMKNGTETLALSLTGTSLTLTADEIDINGTITGVVPFSSRPIFQNGYNVGVTDSGDMEYSYYNAGSLYMGRDSGGTYYENSGKGIFIYDAVSNSYIGMRMYDTVATSPVWRHQIAGTIYSEIEANGDFESKDSEYGGISDERLKENIVDSGSQWDDIKAMRFRKYSFISDNLDAPNQLGVIAQELEASGMAGLVKTKPYTNPPEDGEGPDVPVLDADGNPTDYKSVKYSILYMKAVKALQEAMERIETLEAKVTALENT